MCPCTFLLRRLLSKTSGYALFLLTCRVAVLSTEERRLGICGCSSIAASKHNVSFSCVYQSECARMRPEVRGLVVFHSKCSQPIRGGAQEAGENSLFCLQLQREVEERTWKYTLQQFRPVSTLTHWHIILGVPIPQIKSHKGVKDGPLKM